MLLCMKVLGPVMFTRFMEATTVLILLVKVKAKIQGLSF